MLTAELQTETRVFAPDEHPSDFPGSLEMTGVKVKGRGYDRIIGLLAEYCRGGLYDDDAESPEGKLAIWLYEEPHSLVVYEDSKKRSTTFWFDIADDADAFVAFAETLAR